MLSRRSFLHQSGLVGSSLMFRPPWLPSPAANQPMGPTLHSGLRFRQVHLDFHTSELITDVAQDFDPEAFAATLRKARVNSVTVFGRCHHGYIYHDSKSFASRKHPHLHRNLLKEQIEACHKQGIRTPVYVTVQWDYLTAKLHPEWLMRDENGAPYGGANSNRFQPGFYNHLCVLSPYRDFLKSYIADLFEQVPVDGLFLDIHHIRANANEYCIDAMLRKGMDPSRENQRYDFYKEVMREYKEDIAAFVIKLDKNCTLFYNGGHVGPQIRNTISYNTHLELESLPSGGWGYLHFPLTARYARNFGLEVMGMTGKFHTSWGDFHSLKNKAAIEFETSMMLALNARCSVGDQLHPRGQLDKATYELIGEAFQQVEEKEPWCEGAKAMTEVGVFSTEEFEKPDVRQPLAMLGVVKLLQEGSVQFDVLDTESALQSYKVLILPDQIKVNDALKLRLQQYLQQGGSIIASHASGLNEKGDAFALEEWGVRYVGPAPFSPDYLKIAGPLAAGLPETELVMYERGMEVREEPGTTTLMMVNKPYFNREWDHFSSHKHTPSSGQAAYPGILQKGKVIYFMHPIFSQYAKNAPIWCKKLVLNALHSLHPELLVQHNGPSSLVTLLNEQPAKQRQVLHLLHYLPERKGMDFDIVEDVIPLHELKLSVKLPKGLRRVNLVPQNNTIPFKKEGDRVVFILPKLQGHQMIELSCAGS